MLKTFEANPDSVVVDDLGEFARAREIRYFMVSYTDLFGGQRAKLVPAQAIADMQVDGAGFAGFASWLDLTPAHPDMLAVPDPASVIQLPWKPEVAWLASDCIMESKSVAQAPRNTLRSLNSQEAELVLSVKNGVEHDIFLTTRDGKPYYRVTFRDARREVGFPIWSDSATPTIAALPERSFTVRFSLPTRGFVRNRANLW
jgi:glutamate---methylamine ligase